MGCKHFYVAFASGRFHGYAVDQSGRLSEIESVDSASSILGLAVIRQSSRWSSYEVRNFDHPDFPRHRIRVSQARPLSIRQLSLLEEKIPTSEDLSSWHALEYNGRLSSDE